VLGPQVIAYDQLGEIQERRGNRSSNNAPRNTYITADGKWVAISTSAQAIAERVVHLVGRPELIDEPWFASGAERAKHADELDEAVGGWIAQRNRDEVMAEFEAAQAAVAPIYDITDIFKDEQFAALGTIKTVQDEELGPIKFQNVLFRLSDTPGAINTAGPSLGKHTKEVLNKYGISDDQIAELKTKGVV
jgi:crotonobetainyl-CoA:carnitine CoA-transferase CaiB-like acyl-CoA transferase